MSNSSRPHGLKPTMLLRPWDFPGKSTGVGCHCLLHKIKSKERVKKSRLESAIGLAMSPPTWTSFPPPSHPTLSLYVVTEPWFEFSESYSKLPMASYFTYGNIWCIFPSCYSLRTSHPLLPPHPSSHVRKSVLYVCVSIAALQIGSSVLSF